MDHLCRTGETDSIKCLMEMFQQGFLEKEDLGAAIRAHQTAEDATSSPQRKAAAEDLRRLWYNQHDLMFLSKLHELGSYN